MNKWYIEPQEWNHLTERQQKRVFKKGFRVAGKLMVVLVVFSLVVETIFGL